MALKRKALFSLFKHIFSRALSGFVAVVIILSICVCIGASVYIAMSRAFEYSKPPASSVELRVVCYLVSQGSGYICLASNPLGYSVTLKLYLQGGEERTAVLGPASTKPLFCDRPGQRCQLLAKRILYAEAAGAQGIRVSVVYR
jgi:hypothetical protein